MSGVRRVFHPHGPLQCFFHVEREVSQVNKVLSWAGWLLVVIVGAVWSFLRPRGLFIGWKTGAIILPFLGELRGRLGGDVFSHNKGGDYVRRGTTPTNPQTSRQQTTRTILGTFSSAWAGLTQAAKDEWDVYAAGHPIKNSLGQDILISGLAWFVKCNARLADAGLGAVAEPPVFGAPTSLDTLAVDISAMAVGDVTFTPVLDGDQAMQLWASLPVSLGSKPNLAQCRLVGYSALAEASPWAATLPHGFQSGTRGVFYAAVLGAEGLISAFLQAIDDSDY